MKKQTPSQFVIGVDLGDTKHTLCVTDKQGMILKEFSIPNSRKHLLQLVADYPKARVALEAGSNPVGFGLDWTPSPLEKGI